MIVIHNGWPNAVKYDSITQKYVSKKTIWNQEQNYPDIIVSDILELLSEFMELGDKEKKYIRDRLYAILLRRGVTKWFAVRKLLIRLKKYYVKKILEYEQKMNKAKTQGNLRKYWYYKGKLSTYVDVRRETALLCKGPRWVIFNGKEIGLIDTIGMKKGDATQWVSLFHMLMNMHFEK